MERQPKRHGRSRKRSFMPRNNNNDQRSKKQHHMKSSSIPSHYRQLGPDEVIRRGDRWQAGLGLTGKVKASIGKTPRTHSLLYTYWRRKHVALNSVQTPPQVQVPKQHPIEKNPLVRFSYPSSKEPWTTVEREVRVIGANPTYIVGVQLNGKTGYRKFLRCKMFNFRLVEFSPESIS
jgi:hypothetical protein